MGGDGGVVCGRTLKGGHLAIIKLTKSHFVRSTRQWFEFKFVAKRIEVANSLIDTFLLC